MTFRIVKYTEASKSQVMRYRIPENWLWIQRKCFDPSCPVTGQHHRSERMKTLKTRVKIGNWKPVYRYITVLMDWFWKSHSSIYFLSSGTSKLWRHSIWCKRWHRKPKPYSSNRWSRCQLSIHVQSRLLLLLSRWPFPPRFSQHQLGRSGDRLFGTRFFLQLVFLCSPSRLSDEVHLSGPRVVPNDSLSCDCWKTIMRTWRTK